MNQFFIDFEEYCKSPRLNSNKAKSYANAIKYLCSFLNITTINEQAYLEFQQTSLLIKDKSSDFYNNLLDFLNNRTQSSYLLKGFIQAALSYFFRFYFHTNRIGNINTENNVLIEEIKDSSLKIEYNENKLKKELPLDTNLNTHNYNISVTNGTVKQSVNKIKSGRIAEEYFIDFLQKRDFIDNVDFIDVANKRNYGFDLILLDMGIEIKNIKSGSFFLTDNEIAYLTNGLTHLILIDINNGIWLLKNNAFWLNNIIQNIKQIREHCSINFSSLDLTDIKIKINQTAKQCLVDLTVLTKNQIIEIVKS